jgi:hypothetical protein
MITQLLDDDGSVSIYLSIYGDGDSVVVVVVVMVVWWW